MSELSNLQSTFLSGYEPIACRTRLWIGFIGVQHLEVSRLLTSGLLLKSFRASVLGKTNCGLDKPY